MSTPPPSEARYCYRFPMVSVASDIVCFTIHPEDGLQVALVRRNWDADAFGGFWALPGGFLRAKDDQSIRDCALRELAEETNIEASHLLEASRLELIGVFSDLGRDPREERVISVAFLAVIPAHSLKLNPVPKTDVSTARWFAYDRALQMDLAFDHREILQAARRKLADAVPFGAREDEAPELLFAFLPDRFSIARAEQVMAHIRGVRIDRANFRKWICRYVNQTSQVEASRTRHAHLYERRQGKPERPNDAKTPMSTVHDLAQAGDVAHMERFADSMQKATPMAVAFLEQILSTYAKHAWFALKVTRVPDLRVVDRQNGRVLLTLKWLPRKGAFGVTALATPLDLEPCGLDGLKDWNGRPHRSAFRLGNRADDMARLKLALEVARAALGAAMQFADDQVAKGGRGRGGAGGMKTSR
jgi:8-oxo-dGTP diphosphatase